MSLSDFHSTSPPPYECVCQGTGRVRKYIKDESKHEIGSALDYCPLCHPRLASPFELVEGQVEITQKEFNQLCLTDGWKRFTPKAR
jgi:hypothetical protein